ncbi:glycosyltransferase family 39 protein [Candidatus Roizmanbacteria bacterium]|nr:glycosyltransferase family 39 protein [Candidatus Roizmanbacteria bacterium]
MKKVFKIIIWLLLFSLFLRIFHLSYFISYHQDQVRDLFYIKDHFQASSFILLGPKASVGDFFLPPFWYYLMSLAYLFSKSPLAPAFLTAVLSSITTIVIYLFGRKFFSGSLAFIAATLYAVSPLSIEYSRFAWNPNPIPLFTILTFYFLYKFLFEKDEKSLYWGTISANLAFQLHYQGLVIFIFYFLTLLFTKKFNSKRFFRYFILNFFLVLPFVIYEVQNNFRNTSGIINFLIATQTTAKLKLFGVPFFIKFIIRDFSFFISRVLFFKNQIIGYFALVVFLISLGIKTLTIKRQDKYEKPLIFFLIFSLIMLFFYKNSLIDFYLLFLIPIVIIYFVLVFKNILGQKKTMIVFFVLILINLIRSPTFGAFDKSYLWLTESIKKTTVKKDYCIAYNIFPQTFIESKHRYLMSLVKNRPAYDKCQQIINRCYPKVKTAYYFCEAAICDRATSHLSIGKLIDMKPLDYGVKIYEFDL